MNKSNMKKSNISRNNNPNIPPYYDIFMYFLPEYTKKKCRRNKTKMQFVPIDKVNITGISHYVPYNVTEVKRFHRFLHK